MTAKPTKVIKDEVSTNGTTTPKTAQRLTLFRPGDVCPDCAEPLHVEPINVIDQAVFIWCRCSCDEQELYGVMYVRRVPGEQRQSTDQAGRLRHRSQSKV